MSDFETRLQRLEEIAEKLRDGEVKIDEAAELFEEGIGLSRKLDTELQRIERRVEILANADLSDDAPPNLDLFEASGTEPGATEGERESP